MSTVAVGTVVRASPNRLMNVFIVDEIQFTFVSTVAPALPPFQVQEAQVSYDSVEDLQSQHSFDGALENGQIKMKFDNGVSISATVEPPIDIGSIEGQGVWEQN
ncbi:hypothetical protein ACJZ2D_008884 [Fusarium nematophilum]